MIRKNYIENDVLTNFVFWNWSFRYFFPPESGFLWLFCSEKVFSRDASRLSHDFLFVQRKNSLLSVEESPFCSFLIFSWALFLFFLPVTQKTHSVQCASFLFCNSQVWIYKVMFINFQAKHIKKFEFYYM